LFYRDGNTSRYWLKILAFIIWFVAFLYFTAMLCMCRSLVISIAILEAAADFVGSTFRIILVPIIFFFINFAFFFAWAYGAVCVFSIGTITSRAAGSQIKHVEWDTQTREMMYFMFFGILWIMAFLIACT
jgi:hypothetical protein